MNELVQMHCNRVAANTPRLTDKDIRILLAGLPDWETHKKKGELRLEKTYKFKDF